MKWNTWDSQKEEKTHMKGLETLRWGENLSLFTIHFQLDKFYILPLTCMNRLVILNLSLSVFHYWHVTLIISVSTWNSQHVALNFSHLTWHCPRVTINMAHATCDYRHPTLEMSLLKCHSLLVTVDLSLLFCHSWLIIFDMSILTCHCGLLLVTLNSSLSTYHSRHLTLILNISFFISH